MLIKAMSLLPCWHGNSSQRLESWAPIGTIQSAGWRLVFNPLSDILTRMKRMLWRNNSARKSEIKTRVDSMVQKGSRVPRTLVIGVPAYNEEENLERCLESLRGQDYRDFVAVVSDNASTDGTGEIARRFCAADSRFSYFRQVSNIGASRNFQYILESTNSEFLMYLGAHD